MRGEEAWAVVGKSGWIVPGTISHTKEDAQKFLRQTPFNEHGYHVEPVTITRTSPSLYE